MDNTVAKALTVLEHLARANAPMKASDLARELGLGKASLSRLLTLLQDSGYLEREAETGRYAPTLRMWEVASHVIAAHPVRRAVTPYAQELHRTTGETISIGILDGDEGLMIHKLVSPRPLRFLSREGSRFLAAFNLSGWVMLANEPDAEAIIDRSLDVKSDSPWSREAIHSQIQTIREKGYGWGYSTSLEGVMGLAIGLRTRDGFRRAFLMISGPTSRIEPRLTGIVDDLLSVGSRIEGEAGPL